MPTFVLNDESVINSYGFRTLNKGIDLTRFKSNPIMIDQHWNSTSSVLGKWVNIRIEGSKLLADTEFDSEDEKAKAIEGKVDRGYIKGASMGISYNRENMKQNPDGTYELTKSELYEASIVAIPSNKNSLKLYSESGELMDEKEIKLSIAELQTIPSNNPKSMNKITLTVATLVALGLENNEDQLQMQLAIEKMVKENSDLKADKTALETKLKAFTEANATALVDKAIVDGKLTADMKDAWVKMALSDYESASKTLGAMPTKTTLGNQVQNTEAPEVKTMDEFEKLSDEKKLAFKTENPEGYKALFS